MIITHKNLCFKVIHDLSERQGGETYQVIHDLSERRGGETFSFFCSAFEQ